MYRKLLRVLISSILAVILLNAAEQVALGQSLLPPDPDSPESGYEIAGNNFWSQRGPKWNIANLEAPQVNQIVYDRTNPSIVYAATVQGVYRSVDGGESWEARSRDLGGYGALQVTGLAIDPTDSRILIISTWGYGLMKSTDSGMSWSSLKDPLSTTASTTSTPQDEQLPEIRAGGESYEHTFLAPTPFSSETKLTLPPEIVSPATQREIPAQPQGIPRTISWTPVNCVAINPNNRNELFACVANGYGLFRSPDGGNSWAKVDVGSGSALAYVFAPSSSQVRYVSTDGGLFRSTNGGTSWTQVGAGMIGSPVNTIAIHPTNSNVVLAATYGSGLYRTSDGGNTWSVVSSGLTDTFYYSVAFAPSNPNIVYAGGSWWAYRSNDGGLTWVNTDPSFYTWNVQGLGIHPTQPDTVLFGANDYPYGGVFKRVGSTGSFVLKPSGMDDTFVLDIEQDPANSNILYAATWSGGVFRSNDGGMTWSSKYGPAYAYALEASQGPTSTVLYVGTFYSNYGIYKSFTRGDTWLLASNEFPSNISFDLESIYGDSKRLVAATYYGVQYSYDGGVNWYPAVGLDESTGVVLRLCEFGNTGRMLATTYGGGLFYSWGGDWWYEANAGLSGSNWGYTYDVACSPTTAGLAFAAGNGMWRTTDYGENWQPVNAGLPSGFFRSVDIVTGTGDVFAGSYRRGIFLAPNGKSVWFPINSGLVADATGDYLSMQAMKAVSNSPVRVFVGSNGAGTWDYTLTSRPVIRSVYLPLTLRSYQRFYSATDTYEPNNSLAQAYTLPGPGTYYSYVWTSTDVDWYRLNVTTLGNVTVNLTDIPAGKDYDIELFTSGGQMIDGPWLGGNAEEKIVFQPISAGAYYLRVSGWNASYSTAQAYRLSVAYNGAVGSGQIFGTLKQNNVARANVPVLLQYSNGYRTTRVSTLTDGAGVFRFRGMPTLPVGHTYGVYYPNYEGDSSRLVYWSCYNFTRYQAGQTYATCSPDVAGITLQNPTSGASRSFPITFQWASRGLAGDWYEVYVQRYDPSYAYYYSPSTTGASYTLTSLPAGFSYGPTNYWSVNVWNDSGYGASYYMNALIFSSSLTDLSTTAEPERVNDNLWLMEKGQLAPERSPDYHQRGDTRLP